MEELYKKKLESEIEKSHGSTQRQNESYLEDIATAVEKLSKKPSKNEEEFQHSTMRRSNTRLWRAAHLISDTTATEGCPNLAFFAKCGFPNLSLLVMEPER